MISESFCISDVSAAMTEMVREEEKRFGSLRRQVSDLTPAIGQLHKRIVSDHQLSREWSDVTRDIADISSSAGMINNAILPT